MHGVLITPTDNGPNVVQGRVTVRDANGNEFEVYGTIALCRCGHSSSLSLRLSGVTKRGVGAKESTATCASVRECALRRTDEWDTGEQPEGQRRGAGLPADLGGRARH
jgi:hypothetical protein